MEMHEICERYRKLYVPAVSDVLDTHGYWHQIMDKDFKLLDPGHRVAGPAFTMLGRASREMDKTKRLAVQALDVMYPECVAVLTSSGDVCTGHWGELMTNAALYHKANGAVVDGGLRDTNAIRKLNFPIFHKFTCPGDALGRFNVEAYECPVVAGGVTVNPGDFIFGDCDGIVVVPKALIETVLLEAESVVETEKEIRSKIWKGEQVAQLYLQYEQF